MFWQFTAWIVALIMYTIFGAGLAYYFFSLRDKTARYIALMPAFMAAYAVFDYFIFYAVITKSMAFRGPGFVTSRVAVYMVGAIVFGVVCGHFSGFAARFKRRKGDSKDA